MLVYPHGPVRRGDCGPQYNRTLSAWVEARLGEGYLIRELAEALNLHHTTVRKLRVASGAHAASPARRGRPPEFSRAEVAVMAEKVRSGVPDGEVVLDYGLEDVATLRRVLYRGGYPISGLRVTRPVPVDEIVRLYRSGCRREEIRRRLGLKTRTVRRVIRDVVRPRALDEATRDAVRDVLANGVGYRRAAAVLGLPVQTTRRVAADVYGWNKRRRQGVR